MCEEEVLFKFPNKELIIPISVWEELNILKEDLNKGYVARKNLQLLNRLSDKGNLKDGINLEVLYPNLNTLIKISFKEDKEVLKRFTNDINDYHIIATAKAEEGKLLSMDIGLLSIARVFVEAEEYIYDKKIDKEYKGYRIEEVSCEDIDSLYKNKLIEDKWELMANEFVILKNEINPKHTGIGIRKEEGVVLCDFNSFNYSMKTKPLNLEQKLFLYLLNDKDIKAVTVTGKSGRGKSLLTIDHALAEVKNSNYRGFLYTKSIVPVDEKEYLGFYKGDVEEKLEPHLQPLFSSIEFLYKDTLFDKNKNKEERIKIMDIYNNLKLSEEIQTIPLSDIRGMNIDSKFVMLDEAQNVHRHMIKALLSRLTDNSKIVIAGDIEQIDNPKLSMFNNGLSHLIEKGKNEYSVAHITLDLDKGDSKRGRLSTFASEHL